MAEKTHPSPRAVKVLLTPLAHKYLHLKTFKSTLKLARVKVVEMVETFSVYVIKDAPELSGILIRVVKPLISPFPKVVG